MEKEMEKELKRKWEKPLFQNWMLRWFELGKVH
jgi:hypothetical protein